MKVKATEIFTPGALPTYTYYERTNLNLEWKLLDAMETKGFICSVSGPSKSGKTVLCENVIGKRSMILLTGGGISTEHQFWQRLRSKLKLPNSEIKTHTSSRATEIQPQIKGGINISIFAKGEAGIAGKIGTNIGETQAMSYEGSDGVAILDHIRGQGITLVVDDFHYIAKDVQKSLAEQFKEAARAGNTIVIVSVSHRSDDAIRANPDLRGRVVSIDIPYWNKEELREIASKGYPILNVEVENELIDQIACESISSPQLMQAICLQLCRDKNIEETCKDKLYINLNKEYVHELCRHTISIANCKTAFDIILTGPKVRGSERKIYHLKDGKIGDIYYAILKAVASGEPSLVFQYSSLKSLIEQIVPIDSPRGVGIIGALQQIHKSVIEKLGEDRVLDWDEEKESLNISDPYFLYYLRWASW